jgi:GAF domain-containing protein
MNMDQKRDSIGEYVRQVRESTHQYVKELLTENEKLLTFAVTLGQEVATLQQKLDAQTEAHESFAARFAEVEQLNSNLANLYVASYRLHGSLARADVLATLEEIVINIIGSEKFAVLEWDEGAPRVAIAYGVDARQIDFDLQGPWADKMTAGETWIAPNQDAEPLVVVPLRANDRVTGAIVIHRLLAHKPALEAFDLELFDLLATHAATALHCSKLNARVSP